MRPAGCYRNYYSLYSKVHTEQKCVGFIAKLQKSLSAEGFALKLPPKHLS